MRNFLKKSFFGKRSLSKGIAKEEFEKIFGFKFSTWPIPAFFVSIVDLSTIRPLNKI